MRPHERWQRAQGKFYLRSVLEQRSKGSLNINTADSLEGKDSLSFISTKSEAAGARPKNLHFFTASLESHGLKVMTESKQELCVCFCSVGLWTSTIKHVILILFIYWFFTPQGDAEIGDSARGSSYKHPQRPAVSESKTHQL